MRLHELHASLYKFTHITLLKKMVPIKKTNDLKKKKAITPSLLKQKSCPIKFFILKKKKAKTQLTKIKKKEKKSN